MLSTDLIGGKQAEKWSALSRSFDGRAALRFLAFDDADDGGDDHAGLADGFESIDRGCAGRADIVNNDDARAFAAEALDAASGPVRFFGFANQKTVNKPRSGRRQSAPCAGRRYVRNDWIGAERETADSFSLDGVLIKQIENRLAGQPSAFGVKRRRAAINVIVACAAGRELEMAEAKAGAGQDRE